VLKNLRNDRGIDCDVLEFDDANIAIVVHADDVRNALLATAPNLSFQQENVFQNLRRREDQALELLLSSKGSIQQPRYCSLSLPKEICHVPRTERTLRSFCLVISTVALTRGRSDRRCLASTPSSKGDRRRGSHHPRVGCSLENS